MVQGTFVPPSQLDVPISPGPAGGHCKQVALATVTGAVYIFYNMAVSLVHLHIVRVGLNEF